MVLPMLVSIGALAGELISQWTPTSPVVRASAKQLMAFAQDEARTPDRERSKVNSPRYPTGTERVVELLDGGCSLSMNKRRKHPSK